MSKAGKSGAVSNVERRTWSVEDAAEKARLKEEAEFEEKNNKRTHALTVRAPLKRRDFEVDLYSRVGKHAVITGSTPLNSRGGFHCDVCDTLLKDSASFLDHINGKKHQRALGMNMRPERSTRADVKERLTQLKQKEVAAETAAADIERRLAESAVTLAEAQAAERKAKRDKKKRKKNGAGGEDASGGDATAADDDLPPTGYRGDDLDPDLPPDGWDEQERVRASRKAKHSHIIEKHTAAAATAAGAGAGAAASTANTTNDTNNSKPTAPTTDSAAAATNTSDAAKPQVAAAALPPPPPPPPAPAPAPAAAAPKAKSAEELEAEAMAAMGMSFAFGGSKKNK